MIDRPFAEIDDYALAHRCWYCRAEPGEECIWRRRAACKSGRFHAVRYQAAIAHRNRDIGNAPWPEDRDPGRSYSTIERRS